MSESQYNKTPFAVNLRFYARDRDLSQLALAKIIGTHERAINRWMLGRCSPSIDWLYKLQEALNVSFDDLMSDHGYTYSEEDRIEDAYNNFYHALFPKEEYVYLPESYEETCTSIMQIALNDKTAEMLSLRFGLDGKGIRSYRDIGEMYNVSKQDVQQNVCLAVKKLRRFKPYLIPGYDIMENKDELMRAHYYTATKSILEEAQSKLNQVFDYDEIGPDGEKVQAVTFEIKDNHEPKNTLEQVSCLPIETAGFCVRTYNCLKRGNINTIGEMLQTDDKKLKSIPYLGKKVLADIHDKQRDIYTDPALWLDNLKKGNPITNMKEGA